MNPQKILIVEDDPAIGQSLLDGLKHHGFEAYLCTSGKSGVEYAKRNLPHLVILDVRLPDGSGFDFCRQMRQMGLHQPIVILTAQHEETDKVLGLEIGADDYLTKPFSIREFVARVKAIFRRQTIYEKAVDLPAGNILKIENLIIEQDKRKVILNDNRVELTPKEYDLLVLFAMHPGKNYSREDLLNLIWGYEFSGYEHTVNSHINRLRSKIESDFSKPRFILTTWGVGYRFNDELTMEKISAL